MAKPKIVPLGSPNGLRFDEYLRRRLGPDGAARVGALIQEWDHVRDNEQREPTVVDVSLRWHVPPEEVQRDLLLFRRAFPGYASPSPVVEQLWDARKSEWGRLFDASVVTGDGIKP